MKPTFSKTNLLHILEDQNYSSILQEFSEQTLPGGSLICMPGHESDTIFIVKKGRIRVYLTFEGREFSLAILGRGEIYATHTRAFVTALEEVTLLTMPTEKFHRFMTDYPDFSKTIISVLGQLLKQSFTIIDGLAFKDVVQRLVDFFVYEAMDNGTEHDEGVLIQTDLTVEQIGAMIGSSRQTVSTIINEMVRANVLIKAGRGAFVVPNPGMLKQYPHM